ncbi:hypothetical protein NQ317_000947 [Molorchus minor]|uniref:Titin n=1 Tax=Molorchus minor TaxID=1323400 RepID=A0ABQ9JST1_9CUCU|nr:hypothetical protein NQ317_000947 [Molorchus minor]
MGNAHVKPHPRTRNKKQVHWKAAAHPLPPGKPQLISETHATPDLVTIRWTKPVNDGGSPISGYLVEHRRTGSPIGRRIRILNETDRSVLTIHQSSLSDEGEIKCTATNRAGHVSTKCVLTVQAPPSIRLPRQYEDGLLFEIGETIRLKVSAAGRPTPLVFWSHNGESIKNDDRYEIEYIDRSSVLKINEARRDDRGEYQVKAVNKLGENVQSFLVTVTDKPSPPGKARVVMALGRSVTLSWGTPQDDGGCKIGNYIVEYYRVGWNVWLKAATSRQLSTILGDLIEGSEYKFRVKAESPYGVSDPSGESELIFIPDPKRGILQPQNRGRSQPRDIGQESTEPVAYKRKKSRSQSSSRVEDYKLPEMSPRNARKEVTLQINKDILEPTERPSIARDLAYGSPEIKVKKEHDLFPNYMNNSYASSLDKSNSPSPVLEKEVNHKMYTVKIEPPTTPSTGATATAPSPELQRTKLPKDNNDNFTGSSEFMLVLYPDENETGHSDFDFDESSVPPPMSLSAPELGAEPPLLNSLKNSASSTELLHERAMMRFYQAAEAEEAELEKRKQANKNNELILDIPKIQINSKDDAHIVGLERQRSFRRRMSAGGITHQQALWAQRRHSLRNQPELKSDALHSQVYKSPRSDSFKKEAMMNRQRSESEEREDQAFEEVRHRMKLRTQSSLEKKREIAIADEDIWADDYESSTEESEMSEYDRIPMEDIPERIASDDEEETYHPGALSSEPFEILTKRKEPPDPNFVPKPILKKKEYPDHLPETRSLHPSRHIQSKQRSASPRPQNISQRERSQSLIEEQLDIAAIKNKYQPKPRIQSRPRSVSLLPQLELLPKEIPLPDKHILSDMSKPVAPGHNISVVAEISGITAASIVIPETLLEKKKMSKNPSKKTNTQLYLDRDSLKLMAENMETPQVEEESKHLDSLYSQQRQPIENIYNRITDYHDNKLNSDEEENYFGRPNENNYCDGSIRRSSFTDHYNTTSRRDSLKASEANLSRKQNVSSQMTRERTLSQSPSKQITKRESSPRKSPARTTSPSPLRKVRKTSPSPIRREKHRKTSPSPLRREKPRKTSPSPLRKEKSRKTLPSPLRKELTDSRSRSNSPSQFLRKPMLREIMTQTSVGLESFDIDSRSENSSPTWRTPAQEELIAKAEVKVRSVVDYATDLAMFVVACWLYLFKNELMAIPFLLVMVYRQLQAEISKRIPTWITKRLKRKKK